MTLLKLETIRDRADDFAYITLKMQAEMHENDNVFYGLENTLNRMSSCILACANEDHLLLESAKNGMVKAFNRLKNEQNLPILSYETITGIIQFLDEKLQGKAS
jgi:hypothetical protein